VIQDSPGGTPTGPTVANRVSDPAKVTPPARQSRRPRQVGFVHRYALLLAWAVLIIVFSLLRPDTFGQLQTFKTIFATQAVSLILVLAVVISLNAGEIDLSVGAALGFASTMTVFLNGHEGWPIAIVIVAVLGIGVVFGLFNALLIVRIGIPSPVATLASGTVMLGLGIGVAGTEVLSGVSSTFVKAISTRFFGLPVAFYLALALCFVAHYVLQHTPLGRYLLFVGTNREVARLSAVRVVAVSTFGLVASTTLSVLSGIVLAGITGAADPNVGNSFLLPAFAAAFLGATAIIPGQFNVWGAFAALYFLITGITGLQLLGFVGWVEQVFYGGSLIVALTLARVVAVRASRERSPASST
jgi:ribose transport system permease protein